MPRARDERQIHRPVHSDRSDGSGLTRTKKMDGPPSTLATATKIEGRQLRFERRTRIVNGSLFNPA